MNCMDDPTHGPGRFYPTLQGARVVVLCDACWRKQQKADAAYVARILAAFGCALLAPLSACSAAAEPEPGPPIVVTKGAQDGGPVPAGDHRWAPGEPGDGGEQ